MNDDAVVDHPNASDVAVTRASYDEMAELYTEFAKNHLAGKPFDRAILGVFAELVRGPVADIGCGPGRLTTHLAGLGVDVRGIDLSPEMIRIARRQYPQLSFEVGSMERLALADNSLGGILAWYSLIHLPPERVPGVLNEFYRVLEPEGHALLAFQAFDGTEAVTAFDHKVARAYRWSPERMAELLREAGFEVRARLIRQPDPDERFPEGCLLAVKLRQ
ncbi:putative methyltransferase [Nocardia brasiliensis ATCC 700358]|uniref:Putative methyltransferase n=1 Tax=Nocardia brasiliensis (strain ATCC 700358 / HUJEG-1) TaxID=1133849 RepID=K0F940_NOCB7|nr:putative methyltransferase [Nocardia brasiliensis ATCC 700358]